MARSVCKYQPQESRKTTTTVSHNRPQEPAQFNHMSQLVSTTRVIKYRPQRSANIDHTSQ